MWRVCVKLKAVQVQVNVRTMKYTVCTTSFPECHVRVTPNQKFVAVYDCLAAMGTKNPCMKWKEVCCEHKLPSCPMFMFPSQDPNPTPVIGAEWLLNLVQ